MKTTYDLPDEIILDIASAIKDALNKSNLVSNPQYTTGGYGHDHVNRFFADMDFRLSNGKIVQVTVKEVVQQFTFASANLKIRSIE